MNMAELLSSDALTHFKQREYTLAMYCVDALQMQYEEGEISASDCGRLLMGLAYEMAQYGLSSVDIQPVLYRAADITSSALTGALEVLITASRIHLLKGSPFGAQKQLDRIKGLLPEGIALASIDEALARQFDDCTDAIRRAIDAIYNGVASQVQ